MVALVATDVTVTVAPQARHIAYDKKRRILLKVQFGDGAKTYPAGGVPMPAFGVFGMKRNLDALMLYDNSGTGYVFQYDSVNNKLKMFNENDGAAYVQRPQLAEIQTSVAPAALTLFAEAIGW